MMINTTAHSLKINTHTIPNTLYHIQPSMQNITTQGQRHRNTKCAFTSPHNPKFAQPIQMKYTDKIYECNRILILRNSQMLCYSNILFGNFWTPITLNSLTKYSNLQCPWAIYFNTVKFRLFTSIQPQEIPEFTHNQHSSLEIARQFEGSPCLKC